MVRSSTSIYNILAEATLNPETKILCISNSFNLLTPIIKTENWELRALTRYVEPTGFRNDQSHIHYYSFAHGFWSSSIWPLQLYWPDGDFHSKTSPEINKISENGKFYVSYYFTNLFHSNVKRWSIPVGLQYFDYPTQKWKWVRTSRI